MGFFFMKMLMLLPFPFSFFQTRAHGIARTRHLRTPKVLCGSLFVCLFCFVLCAIYKFSLIHSFIQFFLLSPTGKIEQIEDFVLKSSADFIFNLESYDDYRKCTFLSLFLQNTSLTGIQEPGISATGWGVSGT